MRRREVEARGGLRFNGLVAMKLGPVIDRDRVDASPRRTDERDRAPIRGVDGALGEFPDQRVATLAVDERENAVLGGAPITVSPSRCPRRVRCSALAGRSLIARLPASRPRLS